MKLDKCHPKVDFMYRILTSNMAIRANHICVFSARRGADEGLDLAGLLKRPYATGRCSSRTKATARRLLCALAIFHLQLMQLIQYLLGA
jgi:hypothetical protein